MSRVLQEEFLMAKALHTGMVVRFRTFFHPFKGEDFVITKAVLARKMVLEIRDKRGQYDTKKLEPNREVPFWQLWNGKKFVALMCPHLDKTAPACRCLNLE